MKSFIILFSLLVFSQPVFALTPPLPEKQLEEESDLIVEGIVEEPIRCLGKVDENKCYADRKYSVPMKVIKVKKGKAKKGEALKITFHYYDYGKSNCVGDQTAILHSGDQGIYYLRRLEDGTFMPVHWSGAQVKIHGNGDLPKCP